MSTRRVLPKGSGGVYCLECDAYAAADGKGNPIVLKHDDNCPDELRRRARDREEEIIIRALVEYCDTHPELNVSAHDFIRVLLDVNEIIEEHKLGDLLDAMNRLSDSGNE